MFKFLALATLLIVVSTNSTGLESIFAQVPQSDFGSAIKSMVQLSTQDGSTRLKEISDLLYSIQATIDQQQKNADSQIEKTRQECEVNIPRYEKQLEDNKKVSEDYTNEQNELLKEQSTKKQNLIAENINLESTTNDLTQAKQDLSDENSKYAEYKASFDDAIAACEEAIRLMTNLAGGVNSQFIQKQQQNSGMLFVQLSQRFSDVKEVLQSHIKKGGPAAFVQPVIDILSELSTQNKVDAGKVQQIIQLIQTLLTRLREGLYERKEQYERTKTDLDALIVTLTAAQSASTLQISILETRLIEIQTRLDEIAGLITNIEALVIAKQKLVNDTKNDCQDAEDTYTTETQSRTSNLKLLTELINYYESQVSSAVSNVRDGQIE